MPSMTFLDVASRTSKAGTTCPAAMASILSVPLESLSTLSANSLKWSCAVELAGQLDCILRLRTPAGAGCWPIAGSAKASATAASINFLAVFIGTPSGWTNVRLILHVSSVQGAHGFFSSSFFSASGADSSVEEPL